MSTLIDPQRTPATEARSVPLTYTQEAVWLADRASRSSGPAYNELMAFRLTGDVQVDVLGHALNRLVRRHEALRTAVVETTSGLRAVVRADVRDFFEVVDLRGHGTEALSQARELIAENYARPFDLAEGEVLRALVVLVDDGAVVGLTIHHIATDGWSFSVVVDELGQDYRAMVGSGEFASPEEPAVTYTDYAVALRRDFEQGVFTARIDQQRDLLLDGPELLRLPLDHPRPPQQTFAGSTCSVHVPKSDVAALLAKCRASYRSTEFTVFLAAYAVLLNRYTGQDSLSIGSTLLNRDDEDLLNVVGCFVNTTALVLGIEDRMTFPALLDRVADVTHKTLRNGAAPYPKVLESLDVKRDPSYHPVFQTMFTMLGGQALLDLGSGTTCSLFPVTRRAAKYDVLFYVREHDDTYEFEVEFNTDLFEQDTIRRMLGHYTHLLGELAMNTESEVSRLGLLPLDERQEILLRSRGDQVDYPQSTVVDAFEARAARTPDAVAVEFLDATMTYDELNRLANQVARSLRARDQSGASPFVGVYMERSSEMVVALVAIVKAGLAYVPIDPEYPADRTRYMIENANLGLIMTQERYRRELAGGEYEVAVLSVTEARAEEDTDLTRRLSPDFPVYMIYTSGSTGRPKGVVNRHVSLFNRLCWMQSEYRLDATDRVLQKTPFSFDVSVWEFFWPLMSGARIVVAEPGGHRDADYLKRLIRDRRITTAHFVPSMLSVFLDEEDLGDFGGSLRRVICSGEALPYKTVEDFHDKLDCELHNLYGPTEAAIDVSYWPCARDYPGQVVPIGRPIANVQLYVVDKHLELQPTGVPGELCIGGVGLATGYHDQPELTRKSFVANPFSNGSTARLYRTGDLARYLADGQLQYLGRIDSQVKIRGFRIELDEVGAAMMDVPIVKEAAVVVRETPTSKILVGYVVAPEFDRAVIREHLAKRLPEFMIPQVIVELPALPTTANGKLDRRSLPDPLADSDRAEEPGAATSPEQALLAQVWAEVLGLNRVGVDANFFNHGGDSIQSVRVAARLRESGYAVEVQDIFARPTIRELAELMVSRRAEAPAGATGVPFSLVDPADRRVLGGAAEDAWPLTTLQAGMIYHSMLHEESSVYHDVFDYEVDAKVHVGCVDDAFQVIVARHPQLRSTFDLDGCGEPLQVVRPTSEIPVGIVDLTHLARPDQSGIIDRWVEAERHRAFDLNGGRLLRVQVHVRSAEEMNIAVSFHHALLDGWSVALVVEEFLRVYTDLVDGREVETTPEPGRYGSYVALEREAARDPMQVAFWSQALDGFSASVLSRSRTDEAADALPIPASVDRVVPPASADAVRRLAGRLGVPQKAVYLAVHMRVLGRLLDERRVVSGIVANGRLETRGGEEMVGLFLNTLPFPVELGEEAWDGFVKRVFDIEQSALAYRRFPLSEIQRTAQDGVWFDSVFNYTDFHVYQGGDARAARINGARYFEHTNFPIVVHVHRDHFLGRMRLIVNYDGAKLDVPLAERYVAEYLDAVDDLVSRSEPFPAELAADSGAPAAPPAGAGPRSELEKTIAGVIAKTIGVEVLGSDQNFLQLGVDSITAIRVVSAFKRLRLGLTMKDLFDHPTVRRLAAIASTSPPAGAPLDRRAVPFELVAQSERLFPAGVVDAYPATAMQVRMLRKTAEDAAQATYHDVFSYRLALPLDEDHLRLAVDRLVAEHDVFRTAFSMHDYSVPMQLVHSAVVPAVEVTDLGSVDEGERERLFAEWFEREKQTGFDWADPHLVRFFAHRGGAGEFTLTVSFHHSILDGWSLSLFVRDLLAVYGALLAGRPRPVTAVASLRYRDYVRAELDCLRSSAAQRDFWAEKLAEHTFAALPRPATAGAVDRWSETKLLIGEARQRELRAVASEVGVSLKYVMLACHLCVVSRLVRDPDVVTGLFSNGRLEEDDGERVLGLFLNFLPFRQRVDARTWRELIKETFDSDLEILPHRRYPLARIEQDLGRATVFETVFNYTHFTAYGDVARRPDGTGVVEDVKWFEHVDAPLLTNVGHDIAQARVVITLNANSKVVPQDRLDEIGRLYDTVLAHLVDHVDELAVDSLPPGE
ncbi:amino acid adenylation domain-containing protein [Saccharothrix sp. Mg75]|uniref:amino acid adenylation domain-containing protein n=1 Tax=Saccharothrix sp. Mg75 TaxID=3445357 RepID=UPI003EEF686C